MAPAASLHHGIHAAPSGAAKSVAGDSRRRAAAPTAGRTSGMAAFPLNRRRTSRDEKSTSIGDSPAIDFSGGMARTMARGRRSTVRGGGRGYGGLIVGIFNPRPWRSLLRETSGAEGR
jgi:hypothetical protein